MKFKITIFLSILFFCSALQAECVVPQNALVVLLKLDDVVADTNQAYGISSNWNQVASFLETNGIAASLGIIGESFERDDFSYFEWIKRRNENGIIEFWNHGYKRFFNKEPSKKVLGEFNGTTAENQAASILKTQYLVKQKVGIILHGFGPHDSAVDINTYDQIDLNPEINYVWFYTPLDSNLHNQFVIKRDVELESPIFHPNFEVFMKTYSNRNQKLNYIAMQGHPNEWDEQGFNAFVRTIYWLKAQNATFCRPSEFLKAII